MTYKTLENALKQAEIPYQLGETDDGHLEFLVGETTVQIAGDHFYVYLISGECVELSSPEKVIALLTDEGE